MAQPVVQYNSSRRALLEPWLNEHKSLVYRFQSLVRFWQPLPQFIGILLLCNFLLLWIGSWLTSWSLLTGAALYGLGWLCLETFPLSMPIYNSNAAIPDVVNPETQSGRDRGLKTTGELVDQVDRVVQFLVACIVLLKAFQRAHPRRFFAEMGAILVLCGVLGTKMATPRLLCLLMNVVLLYPGLAERGLIDMIFTKIPAAQLAQVHQLAERVIDLVTKATNEKSE